MVLCGQCVDKPVKDEYVFIAEIYIGYNYNNYILLGRVQEFPERVGENFPPLKINENKCKMT